MTEDDAGGTRKRYYSLREQFPVFFAYGDEQIKFLDHEESIVATRAERIKSVWPFLVKTVLEFAETLKPRSLANYDPEDVLTELYILLCEKDDKWIPERGKYLTFAAKVVSNELHSIRDKANTVHPPRNSSCRLRSYEADEDMSPRKRKTYDDIRRVMGDHEEIGIRVDAPAGSETIATSERREQLGIVKRLVLEGIAGLSPQEADTIGRAYGLWGQPDQSLSEIATSTGKGLDAVKKLKARAHSKIRRKLESIEIPIAFWND